MSCPTPANFDNCDDKCVCRYSDCQDIAYNCSDPCGNGDPSTFNKATCTCDTAGVYKVTQVRSGQVNPFNNGTRCFLVEFEGPSFDALGRPYEVRWMKQLQEWPGGPDTPGSAFAALEPSFDGPPSGFVYDSTGLPSTVYPWGGEEINSVCSASATFCANDINGNLGHSNGRICFGAVYSGTNISTLKFIPYGVNSIRCSVSTTGTINVSREYLGPGRIDDYYHINEYQESSTGYWPIINPSDGTLGCFGPTKKSS